ncbi:hypothetical protein CWO90_18590 [Bradyrhizobium sp. Leo121]|nr:hypothetical protein CWO90_18590 [Bradyrhizobium sp. Leo121]
MHICLVGNNHTWVHDSDLILRRTRSGRLEGWATGEVRASWFARRCDSIVRRRRFAAPHHEGLAVAIRM